MTTLANEIGQYLVIFPRLKVFKLYGHHFGTSQATADQHGKNCPVPGFAEL